MGKEVVHSWTLAGGFCFRPNHRQVRDHGLYRKTLLGMHGAQDEGNTEGKELYAMLVEPARKLILPGSRVIVFPSGSLYGLNLEPRSCPIHSHTSGSRASRSRRQARSGGELFPRAAIVADFATCHPSTSMVVFCKPMNWIQNLVRSTGGFHRRHSCAFGPSRHKLPRSIRSCEPPQPSGEFQGSCE